MRPSALAVPRLTTSLKTVGCWTGKSAGFRLCLSDVNASLAKDAAVSAIADLAAGHDELREKIERRNGMTAQQPSPTVKKLGGEGPEARILRETDGVDKGLIGICGTQAT